MVIFRWIVERIASNEKTVVWVVRGPRVVSHKIKKSTLNFEGKARKTLSQYW